MASVQEAEFQATVSPLLLKLLRNRSTIVASTIEAGEEGERSFGEEPKADLVSVRAVAPNNQELAPLFRRKVLRQDGARPLVLSAMRVWSERTEVLTAWMPREIFIRHLSLYVTEDTQIAAHVSIAPENEMIARPIYRAVMLSDENKLAQLTAECCPELCIAAATRNLPAALSIYALGNRRHRSKNNAVTPESPTT